MARLSTAERVVLWQAAWPEALAAWSRFTRLHDPRLCDSSVGAAKEGLQGAFAMIRLVDKSVVIDLEAIGRLDLDDHAAAIDPELGRLARRRYDATIVCAADFVFVHDGTRQDEAFRDRQNDWYRDQLDRALIPHVIVQGTPLARIEAAVSHLGSVILRESHRRR